ncbi:MAG TPA: hypothetical protein VLZ78_08580, partial [Terrimesophilobacter sp.]|nr:hypothetical protein [Terrimesophilobacter sp.]
MTREDGSLRDGRRATSSGTEGANGTGRSDGSDQTDASDRTNGTGGPDATGRTADAAVIAAARAWRAQDPDAETRAELDDLIDRAQAADPAALAELHSRFDTRLEFGTAGLRGELAAGPNRMNRVLVAQAAAGLAAYLLEREAHPSAVVG